MVAKVVSADLLHLMHSNSCGFPVGLQEPYTSMLVIALCLLLLDECISFFPGTG